MKQTHRENDFEDRLFLQELVMELRNKNPPEQAQRFASAAHPLAARLGSMIEQKPERSPKRQWPREMAAIVPAV